MSRSKKSKFEPRVRIQSSHPRFQRREDSFGLMRFCLETSDFSSCHRWTPKVLSTADLLFLQRQKSEFNPIRCSTFLSSVPKFAFVLGLTCQPYAAS